ncbi:hypothetical protein D920_02839 [Enterococcus faecalis 13-SD-W-01]|nr:hypothetical protein D920_02839 [Enterococcus faecalis 13-SD-W-01]
MAGAKEEVLVSFVSFYSPLIGFYLNKSFAKKVGEIIKSRTRKSILSDSQHPIVETLRFAENKETE